MDIKSEVQLLAEIKKIAVITRSNLVNVVSPMSAAQEHGETCRSYLARIRGLANVCRLSVMSRFYFGFECNAWEESSLNNPLSYKRT